MGENGQEKIVSSTSFYSHFHQFSLLILFEISVANTLLPLPFCSEYYSSFISEIILFLVAQTGV
jgi:hypothetical protein